MILPLKCSRNIKVNQNSFFACIFVVGIRCTPIHCGENLIGWEKSKSVRIFQWTTAMRSLSLYRHQLHSMDKWWWSCLCYWISWCWTIIIWVTRCWWYLIITIIINAICIERVFMQCNRRMSATCLHIINNSIKLLIWPTSIIVMICSMVFCIHKRTNISQSATDIWLCSVLLHLLLLRLRILVTRISSPTYRMPSFIFIYLFVERPH